MKLQRLELDNFRLYQGHQEVVFATDTKRNVTIIFGPNGGGKTTLLNAFLWVLFGTFSDDVQQKNLIVNLETWAATPVGEYAEAKVVLQFENDGSDYVLTRSVMVQKDAEGQEQKPGPAKITFTCTDQSGKSREIKNPGESIDQIIPQRLKDFFFFNGERIENLVRPDAYQEIESAIKTLLGLEVIERSLRHLPEVRKKLQAELSKVGGDETSRLVENEVRLQEKYRLAGDQLDELNRNSIAIAKEIDAIEGELRNLAATQELQGRRDFLQRQHDSSKNREKEAKESRNRIINELGFLAFVPDLMDQVTATSADLRKRGQIPTPLKRQFVEDLLDKGVCICGTELKAGTPAHEHVEEWRFNAGIQEVEEAWTTLAAEVRHCIERRATLSDSLDRFQAQITEEVSNRAQFAEELSEVTTMLTGMDSQNVLDLENKRIRLKEDDRQTTLRIGAIQGEISSLEKQIKEVQSLLRKSEATDKKARVAKDRVSAVEDVIEAMKEILSLRTQAVRGELDERIKSTYRSIAIKDYVPELTEDFVLELWQGGDSGVKVRAPMSTGENQILSLSFVGALAAIARDRTDAPDQDAGLLASLGGVFPIVMDAAFGSLDNNYRRDVARALPKLAPQIIVLVSKAQGEGPVAEELAPHIGATYVMAVHSKREDVPAETIELGAKSFDYVVPGSNSNRTELLDAGGF